MDSVLPRLGPPSPRGSIDAASRRGSMEEDGMAGTTRVVGGSRKSWAGGDPPFPARPLVDTQLEKGSPRLASDLMSPKAFADGRSGSVGAGASQRLSVGGDARVSPRARKGSEKGQVALPPIASSRAA
jgi:hypothetical protein